MANESKALDTTKPTPAALKLAYAAILDGDKLPIASDPEAMSRAIVERIMNAETFEEAFQPQELKSWSDYLDKPVLVRTFKLNNSTFEGEGGSSVYAVVDIADATTGEIDTVTCGGRNVLTQLVKMLEKGWLDKPVKLIAKQTAEGYQALWLQAA